MRALFLFDLDNVLDEEGELPRLAERLAQRLERAKVARMQSAVFCFAFNTESVFRYALRFDAFTAAVDVLGKVLGADEVHCETGMCLVMPQTADVLLQRLASEAPNAAAAGPYQAAWLLSGDKGLVASLHNKIYRQRHWQKQSLDYATTAWTMPPGGRGAVRKPPPRRSAVKANPDAATPTGSTICIDSLERAAWACDRSMDVARGNLAELARAVEQEPWLLSQFGATARTVRGLHRVAHLSAGQTAPLSNLCNKDGLEVRGASPLPKAGHGPQKASVGIGAVRFAASEATVASRLPVSVLSGEERSFPLAKAGLMLGRSLQRFEVGKPLGDKLCKVRLTQNKHELVAKVDHSPTSQPALWWLPSTGNRARSEFRVKATNLLLDSLVTTACPMRPPPGSGVQLSLRAPIPSGTRARVADPIAPNTIGSGWVKDERGKTQALAVLNSGQLLRSGDEVLVQPIHLFPRSGQLHKWPKELWFLPLVVAK